MFHGSVPPSMCSMVHGAVKTWTASDILVGCSGNFTIERSLHDLKRFGLWGNDVTLYSCAIGQYLAGTPISLTVNPDLGTDYGWLTPYLGTPSSTLATVLLASNMVLGLGKVNSYYDRQRAAYREQWPALHAKTLERVETTELSLSGFLAGDALDAVAQAPPGAGVIAFPPFFGNDYEKMFQNLERLFVWETKPAYPEMDGARRSLLFDAMRERTHWLYGTHLREDGKDGFLRGMTQTTNRGTPIYVYSSSARSQIAVPRQDTEPVTIPRLRSGQEIGGRLTIHEISYPQFSALRSLYMNRHIKPGQASQGFAVCADGVMVGVYAVSTAPTVAQWDHAVAGPHVYLMSDFPVRPTDYPKLAKLVLIAALSKESQQLIERGAGKRARSLVTTAYSQRPVSMKYRGLFRLLNRKEAKPSKAGAAIADAYYTQKYMLNYGQVMGQWTLADGFAMWTQKHGQRLAGAVAEE